MKTTLMQILRDCKVPLACIAACLLFFAVIASGAFIAIPPQL